jgi:hypothetical protein
MCHTKKITISIIMLILCSCGGSGHIQFYNFITSKPEVKQELIRVINLNGKYTAPAHWNDYEFEKDSLEDIFIYFKNGPRELYRVGFNNYDDQPEYKDKTTLALVAIFDGHLWHSDRDLTRAEESRIEDRFQTEILSKMKFSYTLE